MVELPPEGASFVTSVSSIYLAKHERSLFGVSNVKYEDKLMSLNRVLIL